MNNNTLTPEELEQWRAGERRRTAFWNRRVAAVVSDASAILTAQQMREVEDYWAQWNEPVNPAWAAWYYRGNGIFKPQYIPSNIYYGRITRALNRRDYLIHPLLADKNYLDLTFPEMLRPEVIVRNINGQFLTPDYQLLTQEQALARCMDCDEVVLKPSIETSGAKNVEFFRTDEAGREGLQEHFRAAGKDFLVQRVLRQHDGLAVFNEDSVNTIRILSLLWHNEVRIIGALVRIGVKGVRVDNLVRSNGISCAIDGQGRLVRTGFDKTGVPCETAPNGIRLEGCPVPGYFAAAEAVKRCHPKVAHFKLIGWDFTVLQDGRPVLIETNLDQPELYFHQFPQGPLFGEGELLEEILRYTYEQYPMYW